MYDRHGSRRPQSNSRKKPSNGEYTEGHRPKRRKATSGEAAAPANSIQKFLAPVQDGQQGEQAAHQSEEHVDGHDNDDNTALGGDQEPRTASSAHHHSAANNVAAASKTEGKKPAAKVASQSLGRSARVKQATLLDGWQQSAWTCSRCTFENPGSASGHCQMCRSERPL